jgi:hypothetical protein
MFQVCWKNAKGVKRKKSWVKNIRQSAFGSTRHNRHFYFFALKMASNGSSSSSNGNNHPWPNARLSYKDTTMYMVQMFFNLCKVDDIKEAAAQKIARENLAGQELEMLLSDVKDIETLMEWQFRGFKTVYPEITGEEAVGRITPILAALERRHSRRMRPSAMSEMRQRFNENVNMEN